MVKQSSNNVNWCWFYLGRLFFWRPRKSFVYLKPLIFFSSNKCDKISVCQVWLFKNKRVAVGCWNEVCSVLFPICATWVTCVLRPCFMSMWGLLKSEKLDGPNSQRLLKWQVFHSAALQVLTAGWTFLPSLCIRFCKEKKEWDKGLSPSPLSEACGIVIIFLLWYSRDRFFKIGPENRWKPLLAHNTSLLKMQIYILWVVEEL